MGVKENNQNTPSLIGKGHIQFTIKMSTEDPSLVHVGSDFGTSNSVVYVCKGNKYDYVPFQKGSQMPSIVIIDGSRVIAGVNSFKSDNIVFKSVKRLLGQSYQEMNPTDDLSRFGSEIVEGPDKMCWYKTEERLYSCDEIAIEIFKELKRNVDNFITGKIGRTIVSVPARYSAKQRYHIKKAAEAAGFEVTNLVNEPTAASVGFSKDNGINGNILVFDLGAGTTDVTILSLENTMYSVESSCGDDRLGGDDFDNILLHYIEDEYKKEYNKGIWDGMREEKKKRRMKKLMELIIHLKHALSTQNSEDIDMSEITGDDYTLTVTRSTFEHMIKPLTDRFSELIEKTISNSKSHLTKKDINSVVLVGGGCFMPCVKRKIHDEFPRAEKIDSDKKMELVAYGCCICAKKKLKPDFNVLDILSHTIGLLLGDNSVFPLFKVGTNLPTDVLEVVLYADQPGITTFETKIVEVLDEAKSTFSVLADVKSSEFKPDYTGSKEFSFRFRLNTDGIFYMEAYALPENKKCVTQSIEGIPV